MEVRTPASGAPRRDPAHAGRVRAPARPAPETARPAAAATPAPAPAPADVLTTEPSGGDMGLFAAFVVATLVMVVGIAAVALAETWWALVPVVLVHWFVTYVVLARINALIDGR